MKTPILFLCFLFFSAQLFAQEPYNTPITEVEYHYVVFVSDSCTWCTLLESQIETTNFKAFSNDTLDRVWILNISKHENANLRNLYKMSNLVPSSALVVEYNSTEGKEVKIIDKFSGYMPFQNLINAINTSKNRFISKIRPIF